MYKKVRCGAEESPAPCSSLSDSWLWIQCYLPLYVPCFLIICLLTVDTMWQSLSWTVDTMLSAFLCSMLSHHLLPGYGYNVTSPVSINCGYNVTKPVMIHTFPSSASSLWIQCYQTGYNPSLSIMIDCIFKMWQNKPFLNLLLSSILWQQ